MASPLTAYSPTGDGRIYSYWPTYEDARTTYESVEAGVVRTGQYFSTPTYAVFEAFVKFDTSAIPDDATITTATLSGYLTEDVTTGSDFIVQARIKDWGADLAAADWVSCTNLDDLTLVATLDSNGIGATGSYKAFTSEAAFVSNVSKTGTTYLILHSNRSLDGGTAPTGMEYLTFTAGSGAANSMKLVVEYTEGTPPTVTTSAISDITTTTATGGGTITDSGDSAVTAYGVCWNTTGTPTITDSHTHDEPA